MLKVFLSCLVLVSFLPEASSFGGAIDLDALDSTQGIMLQSLVAMSPSLGSSITACDFNGDGTKDAIITGGTNSYGDGAVIVIFGGSDFSTVDLSDPAASGSGLLIYYTGYSTFGSKVACLGNVDGDPDGTEDLLIGEAGQEVIFIVRGGSYMSDQDAQLINYQIGSSDPSHLLLDAFAVGDVTGDGLVDVVVSIFDGSEYSGVLIFDLPFGVDVVNPYPQGVTITNGGQSEAMIFAPAGNFNSNSDYNLAVGNLQGNGNQIAVMVLCWNDYTTLPSDIDLTSLSFSSTPQAISIDSDGGKSLAFAGDVDGDGFDDIIIGTPAYNSNAGIVFLIRGSDSFDGSYLDTTMMPYNGQGFVIQHSSGSGLSFGTSVFGDFGSETIVICDESTNCYFVFDPSETSELDNILSEDGFKISNSGAAGSNPMVFANIGDVNLDGSDDYLIGQGKASSSKGGVYILYGPNKCTSPCKTCSGLAVASWTSCTSCESGLSLDFVYNFNCYGSCPSHSYQDSSSSCASCDASCLECTDSTANDCSSCDSGGSFPLFYSDACYGSCPSHTFQDSATTCASCDGSCKSCAGSATICTSCDTSGSLPLLSHSACYSSCPTGAPYTYSSACVAECPSGTSADSKNACITTTVEVPQAVKTLSSTDETRQVSNEIMSTISSLLLGGVHSIRSQSVQGPVSYYVFLNVDYPSNYEQFGSFNFGSSNLPNPFKNTGRSGSGRVSSVNMYLENQSLLANIGYSIIFLIVCILLIPVNDAALVLLEKHKKGYQGKWYHRLLKRSSVSLRWSFLINQFVSKYEDLTFFSFLGIYNAGGGYGDTLNLVVCIFGFLITVVGLVGAFFIIKNLTKKLETLSEEEKEKEEYNQDDFLGRRVVLYKDLKKDRFMTMLYPFFLMVRVFGFSFVTIFLCNETGIQLGFLNLYAVLMLVYLLKYRPLEENGQLWMTLAYEIDGFIALLGVTLLAIYNKADGSNENTRTAFGYLIILANTGMLVLNFISFGLEMFEYGVLGYEKLKMVYEKLKNRKKVKPEPIQSQEGSFMSPTSSFVKGQEETPSVIPAGHVFFKDDSPGLPSPNTLSEVKLNPFSSHIEDGDKSTLIKLESTTDFPRNSLRKFTKT